MTDEQFKEEKKRPEILRSCYNCTWLRAALNLWCTNKEAGKARGTYIPGCIHCPFWEPDASARKTMRRNTKIDNFMIVG